MPALHHNGEFRKPRCLMLIALGVTCVLLYLLLWFATFIVRHPNSPARQNAPWRLRVALVEAPPVRNVLQSEA
jgi:hypothetical protein